MIAEIDARPHAAPRSPTGPSSLGCSGGKALRSNPAAGGRRCAMPRVTINGTELYFEIRGTGPPVLQ
jgi:hypothetical protein